MVIDSSKNMKGNITFIVVSYHPDKFSFRELLLHLSPNRVIVVDNGGTAESGITNIETIHAPKNLGYGAGANLGIRKALDEGAEWVVVANQDVSVSQKSIQKFVEALESTPAGIAGPVLGSLEPHRWTTMLGGKKQKYMYVSGSFMAIHKDVIHDCGQFYEPYFMYYEEVDLCIRAQNEGFPMVQLKVSGITHEESISLGSGSAAHEYYLSRNHLLFLERCAPWSVRLYEYLRIPKTFIEYQKKGNAGAVQGMRDYFLRKFDAYEG